MLRRAHENSKLYFLMAAIFLTAFLISNQALAYSDPADHYSINLPSGWEEIPKSVIDKYRDEAARQSNAERIEYAAGFQLAGSEYFKYPYILVQKHEVSAPSFSQLEKTFNNTQEIIDKKDAEYSELLRNATADKPFIDKDRNIIFMNIQLNAENAIQIDGLVAMFLGKNSITQLNFYSTKDEYSRWIPVFNTIIDSFKYDDGFAYNPTEAKKNVSPSIFEGATDKGISGAIAGGFLGLLVGIGWLFKKRKSKRSGANKKIINTEVGKEYTKKYSSVQEDVDPELMNLKSKPWYRFLKILFIVGFCFLIYFVSTRIYNEVNPSATLFDNEKTVITCDNGNSSSAKNINLDLNSMSAGIGTKGEVLNSPAGGGRIYRGGVVNSSYPLLKFCNPQKINSFKDAEDAYTNILKNYKIDFQYKTEWLKFFTYLMGSFLLLLIAFESLRQLGYYIFLGYTYPNKRIIKLIQFWK
jgi:hypothetical protein